MKLEVGMYVRTNGGNIRKIENFKSSIYNDFIETPYKELINKKDIKKASHNIIDLIEVGDYVNGYKVSFKGNDYQPFVQCDYPVECGQTNHYRFYEKAIYSIVTKEQFSSMEYRLGD